MKIILIISIIAAALIALACVANSGGAEMKETNGGVSGYWETTTQENKWLVCWMEGSAWVYRPGDGGVGINAARSPVLDIEVATSLNCRAHADQESAYAEFEKRKSDK